MKNRSSCSPELIPVSSFIEDNDVAVEVAYAEKPARDISLDFERKRKELSIYHPLKRAELGRVSLEYAKLADKVADAELELLSTEPRVIYNNIVDLLEKYVPNFDQAEGSYGGGGILKIDWEIDSSSDERILQITTSYGEPGEFGMGTMLTVTIHGDLREVEVTKVAYFMPNDPKKPMEYTPLKVRDDRFQKIRALNTTYRSLEIIAKHFLSKQKSSGNENVQE